MRSRPARVPEQDRSNIRTKEIIMMNCNRYVLSTLAFGIMMPALATAENLSYEAAQVQIQVPDGWKQEPSENSLTVTAPDSTMTVVFSVLEAQNINDAISSIDSEVEKAVGKIAWKNEGKGQDLTINGMEGKEFVGTANEGAIVVDEIVLDTPAKKVLAIYWFSTPEADKKYAEEIKMIVQGIQPMEASGEDEEGGEGEGEEGDGGEG
jgi:hypothetical protein